MTIPTHPLTLLERNVAGQLQASREIFDIVLELTNVADKISDDAQKPLENIMRRLLTIGEKLSQEAESTGQAMLNLISTNIDRSSTFATHADQGSTAVGTTPYSRA